MEQHFLSTERKINSSQLKHPHPAKYLSKTKAKLIFLRPTKSERICHHQISTVRSLKGILRQKENNTICKARSTQGKKEHQKW